MNTGGPRSTDDRPLEIADLDALARRAADLKDQLGRVIVGQAEAVEQLLVSTFCLGHSLIVGAPGLAKTMLVRSLASSLHLDFKRIQFTPDMMPSDVVGAELLQIDPETGRRSLQFAPGPVFASVVLADEINRTPPKTQAALLEAMAERQVSVGGVTRALPAPFLVFATQNPIEQEGTYPLPEAQLDRFFLSIRMGYPEAADERRIVADTDGIAARATELQPIIEGRELLRLRRAIGEAPASEHVIDYAVALARATRPDDPSCPASLRRTIAWGAGPRAAQTIVLGAKCLALLEGAPTPDAGHVRRIAPPALRHRIVLNYTAGAEGVSADDVVAQLLREVAESSYD